MGHMTVLFRRGRRWSKAEMAVIDAAAAQWKRERNGHETAPTTFTLREWGTRSVAICGDLEALCLALRRRFASLSSDAQRIPHCELFRGDLKRRRAKTAKAAKRCLICGDDGHFKRRCPHKLKLKKEKGAKAEKKSKKAKDSNAKAQKRLTAMLRRMRAVREKKESAAAILREHEQKMEALQCVADAMDGDALSAAIAEIARSFKERKRRAKSDLKSERKMAKRKMAKRNAKERRNLKVPKRIRCWALPKSRLEMGGASRLRLFVDGQNAMSADSLCRKAMRRRNAKWARARMLRLIRSFAKAFDAAQFGFELAVTLCFDGDGDADLDFDGARVSVAFAESVGDALLSRLSAIDKAQKCAVFVVSSDENLALRCDALGVRVIKSKKFHKKYLKPRMADAEEEKDDFEDEEKGGEDDDSDSGDGECEGDEIEGAAHRYASPFSANDDGEDDHEFTQIFGEMEMETDTEMSEGMDIDVDFE